MEEEEGESPSLLDCRREGEEEEGIPTWGRGLSSGVREPCCYCWSFPVTSEQQQRGGVATPTAGTQCSQDIQSHQATMSCPSPTRPP